MSLDHDSKAHMGEVLRLAREHCERAWREYLDLLGRQDGVQEDNHAAWCPLSEALEGWSAAQARYYALLLETSPSRDLPQNLAA